MCCTTIAGYHKNTVLGISHKHDVWQKPPMIGKQGKHQLIQLFKQWLVTYQTPWKALSFGVFMADRQPSRPRWTALQSWWRLAPCARLSWDASRRKLSACGCWSSWTSRTSLSGGGGECNQQMPYYRRKTRWICWKFQWMRSIDPRHALNMTASSTDMTFTYIHSKISQRVQDGESTNVLPEFGPDVLFTTCKREASKLRELAFITASTHPPLLGLIVFL